MSKRTSGQAKSKTSDREHESFRGQTAFRNRDRQTGLDPFDTYAEQARSQGIFLRQLLTGRLRTRNGIALMLMSLGGLGCLLPLVATLVELGTGASPSVISRDYLEPIRKIVEA